MTKTMAVVKNKVKETNKGLAGVDETRVLWPVGVFASSDDGNVPENTIDRDLNTRWSSVVGDGEWICYQKLSDSKQQHQNDNPSLRFHDRHLSFLVTTYIVTPLFLKYQDKHLNISHVGSFLKSPVSSFD